MNLKVVIILEDSIGKCQCIFGESFIVFRTKKEGLSCLKLKEVF